MCVFKCECVCTACVHGCVCLCVFVCVYGMSVCVCVIVRRSAVVVFRKRRMNGAEEVLSAEQLTWM